MLKFVFKNMLVKKMQIILLTLSIILSCGVSILAYNTATQIKDGITSNASYYSLIIGPSGSNTQLVMNTIYYTDSPVGTIPYELVTTLKKDSRVKAAIPYAMADSYQGYNLVGTTKEFFENKEYEGEMFAIPQENDECFEVLLGYSVAKATGLKIGDSFYTSHAVGQEHHTPFKVVGILSQSNSMADSIIYTHLKSIWLVHEEGEEAHDEDEMELNNMVCAIIVKTDSPTSATALASEYNNAIFTDHNSDAYSLQAIEPMAIIRSILSDVNSTKYIVYVLCGIIMVMNLLIITITTLLNLYHSVDEIALMRLIGISMRKINLVYFLQNSFIGLLASAFAFGLSRLALLFMNDYCKSLGVSLNNSLVYPLEFVILFAVWLISVLPTLIATNILSKKDSLGD